jgi:hypothetical protein
MKTKLPFRIAILSLLLASLTATLAQPTNQIRRYPTAQAAPASPQPAFPPPGVDPNTGLPLPGPQIDPATGLPPEPQWIDPNWAGPNEMVTNLSYNGVPLDRVAKDLRERFNGAFNILPLPHAFNQDWGAQSVDLQLKNVSASEIFNAMNLVFENDRTPVRWELKNSIAGGAPYALLRVLPQANSPDASGGVPPPPATQREVYFVGDLVGDEKSGGLTMDQITKTILDIWPADFPKPDGVIQFHKEAQLLVVNGTPDEIEFIRQTLKALQEKGRAARPKTEADKDIDEQINRLKSLKSLGNDSK